MAQPPKTPQQGNQQSGGVSEELSIRMVRWTRIVGVFTGLLFFASAIADGFIWWQASTANSTQADIREQSRAFVTFVGAQQINYNDPTGTTINYNFQTHYHNWGTTRTNEFDGWTSVKYFENEVPNNMDFSKPFEAVPIVPGIIGGNADAFEVVNLPSGDAIKAKDKQGIVIIWGFGEWADIYHPGIVNPVRFCLKLVPAKSDGDNNIVFQPIIFKPECNSGMAAPKL